MVALAVALAAGVLSVGVLAAFGEDAGWQRERGRILPLEYANPDIVAIGQGRFRAYLMGPGGIVSALSPDGRHLQLEAGERVPGGSHHALVRLPDGRLRMYYSRSDPGSPRNVVSAVSSNGLDFQQEPGVRLRPGRAGAPDAGGIIHPHVIKLPGGGYRMYYDADAGSSPGEGPNWKGVRSATSANGLDWTKEPGFRIVAGMSGLRWADLVWSPFAQRRGARYVLYFSVETDLNPRRRAGIYRARSDGGRRFTVEGRELGIDPSVPDPQPGPGGMTGLPQDPFIIRVSDGARLFYWQAQKGNFTAFRSAP